MLPVKDKKQESDLTGMKRLGETIVETVYSNQLKRAQNV
jgi:hypothetical protein